MKNRLARRVSLPTLNEPYTNGYRDHTAVPDVTADRSAISEAATSNSFEAQLAAIVPQIREAIDPTKGDSDWLTLEALDRLDQNREAERLEEFLSAEQPRWYHSLIIGKSGSAAVCSEQLL